MPDGINFEAPANSNNAVMVNNSNQLRNPTATALLEANPEIAKASDMTNYNAAITSLEKKTQNMTATIGRTYFAGTLVADYIEGAGGGGGGDIEGDVTVDSLLSKSIIQANYYGDIESEDYHPNKIAKGWRLAWRNNYDSDAGTADLYLVEDEELRFTREQICGAELPATFVKANLTMLSTNDVLYFFNYRHFPKAFYITAVNNSDGYISVKEIMKDSLYIPTTGDIEAAGFRYGMFVVGSINTGTGVITYSNTKLDYGKINLTESAIINGWNCGASISSIINGRDNLSFGSYSASFGRNNTVLSYTSAAFGQQNTVFGEKSFAFGTKNNIDADIGNAVFGANNAIIPDADWKVRDDFSRYDTCFISGNSNQIILNDSIPSSDNGTYLGLFGVGLKGIQTVYPQFITGRYNDTNVSNMLEIVGNGTADDSRSNARTLDKDGNAVFGGDVTDGYGNVLRTIASAPTQLMQTKLNAGALHFLNGEASNTTFQPTPKFSFVCIASPDYNGDIITFGDVVITIDSGYVKVKDNGTERISIEASSDSQNVICFHHTAESSTLKVNTSSDSYAITPITGLGYILGSSTSSGALSHIMIFDFDIMNDASPYKLSDYVEGKPVPPLLKGGFYQDIRANYAGYIQRASTPSVSFTDSTNLELTISDDSSSAAFDQYIAWKLPRKLLAGETIKVSGEIILKTQSSTGYYNLPVAILTSATSFGTGRQNIPSTTVSNKETISTQYTLTASAEYIGFYRGMNQGTGDKQYEIVSFNVEIDGETLALENYTVLNGGTQTIFDVSGYAQDATVSAGSIAGDNDISVARLVDFISAI